MRYLLTHRSPHGFLTMSRTGRFLFSGAIYGVDVWEMVESRRGPTFKFQRTITWSEELPEYGRSLEDYFDPVMMQCLDGLLAVAHNNGLVTVWDLREGSLKYRIDHYYYPDR